MIVVLLRDSMFMMLSGCRDDNVVDNPCERLLRWARWRVVGV